MKLQSRILLLLLGAYLSSCVSQSQLQSAIDNSKRLETLIEKERKENDQLNASRSVLEAQIQNLSSQVQKLQAEKLSINETFNASLIKSKEEKTRLETKIKALESTVAQQSENNKLTVAALGEKINDLAEDKRELNNKIYTARKKVTKKRRRRR